ncbi:MAG: phosphoribosylanthranilate isomerase [Deltaproteobacteria bacterium]|nr:phosphoribosylanthranilate isomerase [Deltaproteobacteria bacterium]MBW2018066.1 phosphoribosylanthranilate isomerase [Deltaproteobacteria bacterium]MBW2130694.1 phosphoribosylanthranilate isomerase [Deltaproteobacteria bacterium]MBW2304871.1 phosphoribosylanthranilate isomerase [Deltaproteobacteria bacterium]
MTVRVKICGITSIEDALDAVSLGADALGFVFAPSPRRVRVASAREIIRRLPPFVQTVGVFVDENVDRIREIMMECGLDLVQLHGDEPPEVCKALGPRAVKGFRIKDRGSLRSLAAYKDHVRGYLLDAFSERRKGGTGKTFDWGLALEAKALGVPLILAGGLDSSNVMEAVERVRPWAVDVSSGVEERPGKKNRKRMEKFISTAKRGGR